MGTAAPVSTVLERGKRGERRGDGGIGVCCTSLMAGFRIPGTSQKGRRGGGVCNPSTGAEAGLPGAPWPAHSPTNQ